MISFELNLVKIMFTEEINNTGKEVIDMHSVSAFPKLEIRKWVDYFKKRSKKF